MVWWFGQGTRRAGAWVCLAWLVLAAIVVPAAWYWVFEQRLQAVSQSVASRADAYVADVRETLSRFDTLPASIARTIDVSTLLQASQTEKAARLRAVGVMLTQNAVAFRTGRILIVDSSGIVVATDDWLADKEALMGQHVGQYSLVHDALRGQGRGAFALGLAAHGVVYVSTAPVVASGQVLGAVVVEATPFEAREHWFTGDDTVLVLDDQGYTALASRGNWRFRQLVAAEDAGHNATNMTADSAAAGALLVTDTALPIGRKSDGRLRISQVAGSTLSDQIGDYAASSRSFQDVWTILVLRPLGDAVEAGRWAGLVALTLCVAGLAISLAGLYIIRLRAIVQDRMPVDPLTGLFTATAIVDRYEFLQAIKSRGLIPELALVVFDVKDLRRINIRHGRAAGDRVLREIGVFLRRYVRTTDTAFRLGKDDLAVLLPVRDTGRALVFAERVQAAVGSIHGLAGLPDGVVRLDFGVALCVAGETLEQAAARADEHLRRQVRERREGLRSAA